MVSQSEDSLSNATTTEVHTTLPLMETVSPRQQFQFRLERRIPLSKILLQTRSFSPMIEKRVFYLYQKMKPAAVEAEKKDDTHMRWKEIRYHNLLIRGA
ncbi:hypothetical protein AAHA92_21093 [Salvia divinorum]|uniref:Uncharacterized protein n=1 Tax=Salvia divinorum TaxID=28513 RepID=A0ABD1GJR1_SALDI